MSIGVKVERNKVICIITANQLETENPARNRILSLVTGFINDNYKVKLISMDRHNYSLYYHESFEHYKIDFINTKISSFLKRAFLELRVAINALRKANQLDCNINLITIPSMFLLHLSFILNKNSKNILDVRDLSWEYLSDSSIIQRIAKNLFRQSAFRNLRNFDIIDVTNDHELNYIKSIVPEVPVLKMPNGISMKIYTEISSLPKKIDDNKNIVVTYIGNIGLAQDLTTLVNAHKRLTGFYFNIVGSGTDFERVFKTVDVKSENIKFWGQVDFDILKNIYQETDVLYAQLAPDFSGAMPSKLYEYLATGKHVVYGGANVAVNILESFENVSIIDPQNVEQLISVLQNIKANKSYKVNSASNRTRIYNEFVREQSVAKFIEFIDSRLS